jgi:hypothetical protein
MTTKAKCVGTIALCLSVVHDAAPYERGKYMGAAMTG